MEFLINLVGVTLVVALCVGWHIFLSYLVRRFSEELALTVAVASLILLLTIYITIGG
jgi:hypothetical protein